MPPLEALAAAFGLVNIVLLARRSVWNFPFGLAMVSLYGFVFWEARLLSAVLLQGFFMATQLWGWWSWRQVADGQDRVVVGSLPVSLRWAAAGCTVALAAILGLVMSRFADAAVPFFDAANTSLSIVAQLLTMARRVEGWPLWALVNALSILLYASQGLWITAALYGVFLVISVWSWREWRQAA